MCTQCRFACFLLQIERAKASTVIKNLTKDHERALAMKLHELGLISDEEEDEHFIQPQQQRR